MIHTKQPIIRAWPVLAFLFGLSMVYLACLYVVGIPEFHRGNALPFAVTVDLTLTVPALYYFLIIRRVGLPVLSVVPVFIASVLIAAKILPNEKEGFLSLVEIVAALAELFILFYVVRKALRFRQKITEHGMDDPVAAIRHTFQEMLGRGRAVSFIAAETTILYFALFSWRQKPPTPDPETRIFPYHRNSGWKQVLLVLGCFMVLELFFVHILLARWNVAAAWVATSLGIYGVIWMMGDYRAQILRPLVLGADMLKVRVGLRWETDIPVDAIERVWIPSVLDDPPDGHFNAAVLSSPSVMIKLKGEATAAGLFGVRRRYRALGISVDQPHALLEAVEPRSDS